MKVNASFEDGLLSLILLPETLSDQLMIGAIINQPQDESSAAYMDKSLISASLQYHGHWSNKLVTRLTLTVYRPNEPLPDKAA